MSFEAQRAAIETYLNLNWHTTEIHYDNVPFVHEDTTKPYINLIIIPAEMEQTGMGGTTNNYRVYSVVQIDIFVPEDTGTKTIATYTDTLIALFRGQTLSGITFRDFDFFRGMEMGFLRWTIRCNCFMDYCA